MRSYRRQQGCEVSQLDTDSLDCGNQLDGAVLRVGDEGAALDDTARRDRSDHRLTTLLGQQRTSL